MRSGEWNVADIESEISVKTECAHSGKFDIVWFGWFDSIVSLQLVITKTLILKLDIFDIAYINWLCTNKERNTCRFWLCIYYYNLP